MMANVKTRPVRIQRDGKIHYLGRAPESAARSIEEAARGEYARTQRVPGAKTVRQAPGCVVYRDDPVLWAAGMNVAAPGELSDELRLMLAVFRDAAECLQNRDPRVRLEAERWFAVDDRSHLYAFATICDAFGVEPEHARRGVMARARRALNG